MAHASARSIALAALSEWRHSGRFADSIMQEALANCSLGTPDRGFAHELFNGVLRNLTLLDFWISLLRTASVDDASRDLLRLGLYQLFFLQTPAHAAVFETVALSRKRNRSLVNAILRSALRRADELKAAAENQPLALRWSHPAFFVERWIGRHGKEATAELCRWDNEPPPVYARINVLKTTLEQFLAENPTAEPVSQVPSFVRLAAIPFEALDRGEFYIQDPSTSIACALLDPQPGETILDACAAPGGKTNIIAQMMKNTGSLIACDRDAARVERLTANLRRLGVTCAKTIQEDWSHFARPGELNHGAFDRILVDAPCSNTGVMRRRVDVRWRLSPGDLERMPNEQWSILRAVVPLLKVGGVLVYSTCSIEPEENEAIVARLLQEFPRLEVIAERSVLPFRDQLDGAFAALFRRAA